MKKLLIVTTMFLLVMNSYSVTNQPDLSQKVDQNLNDPQIGTGDINRPLEDNEVRFSDSIFRVMQGMNSNSIGVTAIVKAPDYDYYCTTTIEVDGLWNNYHSSCVYNNLNTFINVPEDGPYLITIRRGNETKTLTYLK